MKLSDSQEICANRAMVWAALLSADVLKQCIPGCKELTGSSSEGFCAIVVQKVGPIKATFKGDVILSGMIEHQSLILSGEGQGGVAGFAKGGAKVILSDTSSGGTKLEYSVEANVGGKLAQLGSRIIDGFTKKMATQFFEKFSSIVGDEAPHDTEKLEADVSAPQGWISHLTGR